MGGDLGVAHARDQSTAFTLPPGCAEGYVAANGIHLHYVAAGEGPLVLLLHGFPEFWYSWRAQLPALAAAGRRVVALDLRGYNLSDKPDYGYDLATLSGDIREVITAFGERQADVVGHDWGGALAWVFAIREPDYVRRLAILNGPHPGMLARALRHPRQLLRSAYIGFFQLRGLAEAAIRRDDYAMLRRTFRDADPARAWLTDADIQRFVEAIARPGALSAALAYYRQLVRTGPATLGPARVIHAPTLVLWGELDPYLGPELLSGLDAWVRDPRLQRFPTAGHWLNQQEPERVNEALAAFLTDE
ncbi:MAG: alpha/beta hydrolase [Ktedonobacterales bacterium]|nr:alpha/beta hydrolase [Ktedonobacterales bacterium]